MSDKHLVLEATNAIVPIHRTDNFLVPWGFIVDDYLCYFVQRGNKIGLGFTDEFHDAHMRSLGEIDLDAERVVDVIRGLDYVFKLGDDAQIYIAKTLAAIGLPDVEVKLPPVWFVSELNILSC